MAPGPPGILAQLRVRVAAKSKIGSAKCQMVQLRVKSQIRRTRNQSMVCLSFYCKKSVSVFDLSGIAGSCHISRQYQRYNREVTRRRRRCELLQTLQK